MLRWIILVLIVLWLCLLAISGVNAYRQYQVGKQNMRIIKDYELKSEVDKVFTSFHDSIDKDIALAEQGKEISNKSFPLKDSKLNWLLLRIVMIVLAVSTVIVYWAYYKKLTKD